MNQSLKDRIATQLESEIAQAAPGTLLAPIRELCTRFDASAPTVWAALRILNKKGLITSRQGGRTQTGNSTSSTKSPTVDILRTPEMPKMYSDTVAKIKEGVYRTGERLPKRRYFMMEYCLSSTTVTRIMHKLHQAGFLSRRGRSWIVGKGFRELSVKSVREPYTIIVLNNSTTTWEGVCLSERTRLFGTVFALEAQRAGVRLQHVYPAQMSFSPHCLEIEPLRKLINDLGPAYLGTLVPFVKSELDRYVEQICSLFTFKRPVVWFDREDKEPDPVLRQPNFRRCHFSEKAAIDCAIESLIQYGHCKVGYIVSRNDDWVLKRAEMLKTAAKAQTQPIAFHSTPPANKLVDMLSVQSLEKQLGALVKADSPLVKQLLERHEREGELLKRYSSDVSLPTKRGRIGCCADIAMAVFRAAGYGREFKIQTSNNLPYFTPLMLNALDHQNITCLIAANDAQGKWVCYWLYMAGYRVPEDISVLSFDNAMNRKPSDLASIDFGFDYLGYAAFHSIVKDIPIRCRRNGDITAIAKLAESRTLGPALKKAK